FEPFYGVVAGQELRIADQFLVQRNGGLHAFDDELLERAAQAPDAALAVGAVDDQLADHAVVVRRDLIAGVEAAIDADVHAARRDVILHQAGRGGEGLGVLGVDPALDRVTVELDLVLGAGQAVALRDADLL